MFRAADIGVRSHWSCKRHFTINQNGKPCPVCVYDIGGARPSLRVRIVAELRRLRARLHDAVVAIGDALDGQ